MKGWRSWQRLWWHRNSQARVRVDRPGGYCVAAVGFQLHGPSKIVATKMLEWRASNKSAAFMIFDELIADRKYQVHKCVHAISDQRRYRLEWGVQSQ
jgi:hypothetical protein